MAYWGLRFVYALFVWFFVLPETIFFDSNANDVTFFTTIILFVFPFFLDYVNIRSMYKNYCYNIPLIISIVGMFFGLGGLMTETLTLNQSSLFLFHKVEIPANYVWFYLFLLVIFTAIDMGRIETKEGKEIEGKIRKLARNKWLEDRSNLELNKRHKEYLELRKEDSQ